MDASIIPQLRVKPGSTTAQVPAMERDPAPTTVLLVPTLQQAKSCHSLLCFILELQKDLILSGGLIAPAQCSLQFLALKW